jgi:S-DNA-T family DNA segregation ATPase FtsK/SpoIIIE
MDQCRECGFVYDGLPQAEVAGTLRTAAAGYRTALAEVPEPVLRQRPAAEVWSALEYTCHVRDVLLVQRDRTLLALVESGPSFAHMYRDERVALANYGAHPASAVAEQLLMAAELCATVFDGLAPEQWRRPLVYNFPEATARNLIWLGRNTVHEVEHHLGDIRDVTARVGRH